MNAANLLDVIEIASPCSADWNAMSGDERKRFCSDCKLHVYNIAELTRAEAEELISTHEGRLCGRLYKRKDGTVITRDCPVGLRAVRRRLARSLAAVATVLGLLTFGTVYARGNSQSASNTGPLARLISWVEGEDFSNWVVGEIISVQPTSSSPVPSPPSPPTP